MEKGQAADIIVAPEYTCMNVHQHLYMIYVYICIYLYRHVCPYWAFESDLASFISLSIRLNTDVVGLICRAKAREWGWEFGRSSKHLISLHIYFIRIRHFRDLLDSLYLWIFDGSCHFRHFSSHLISLRPDLFRNYYIKFLRVAPKRATCKKYRGGDFKFTQKTWPQSKTLRKDSWRQPHCGVKINEVEWGYCIVNVNLSVKMEISDPKGWDEQLSTLQVPKKAWQSSPTNTQQLRRQFENFEYTPEN